MSPIRRREGFTIIEMLVVVGVIAVLLGLLLPALSGAQKRSKKNTELSYLRQIGFGWTMYANNYNDAALPGYLPPEVQTNWDVSWQTQRNVNLSQDNAAPYSWRLMPFIDFSLDIMRSYDDSYELDMTEPEHVKIVARHPAFGYNAYYIGGWYQMVSISGQNVAKPSYHDGEIVGSAGRPANVVATHVTKIRRPSDVITFCSSTVALPGVYKAEDYVAGSHLVHAPTVAEDEHWTSFVAAGGGGGVAQGQVAGSIYEVNVLGRSSVPLGRYTKLAAVLYADGHTDTQTPGGLDDQRKWIDSADDRNFTHTQGSVPLNSFNTN